MLKREFAFRLATVFLFVIMSVIGIVISSYLVISAPNPYLYFLAWAFLMLSIISSLFNVFSAFSYYKSYFYDAHLEEIKKSLKPVSRWPTVAMVVPSYNEDPKMVEKNLLALKEIDYPKNKVKFYLLDDSTDLNIARELERFSKENGIIYLHREERKGFKAGALNNMLKYSKEEFIAIFDADEHLIDKSFLKDTIPYFQDPALAFIQTEKRYAPGNFFSSAVDLFDAFFFKFIQPARALNNTAIFAGSCGIIRRSALDKVNGFPEFVIEDTFFSFVSDLKGFKGLYLPKVYALGAPIMSFTALARQQWRYNYGDTQFLLYFLTHLKKTKRNAVSALSKIDYALHGLGLNYLSIILILFTIVSLLSVFASTPVAYFGIRQLLQFKMPSLNLQLFGFDAFLLSILVPIAITKLYFNSISKGLMLFVLNFALAFVRFRAAMAAIFNLSPIAGWIKGDSTKATRNFLLSLKNSAVELAFSAILFFAGIFAFLTDNLSGSVWLFWYSVLYFSTFAFFYRYG